MVQKRILKERKSIKIVLNFLERGQNKVSNEHLLTFIEEKVWTKIQFFKETKKFNFALANILLL